MAKFTTIGALMHNEGPRESRVSSVNSCPTRTDRQSVEIFRRYGTQEQFLTLFNPSHQIEYTRDIKRVYMGSAPSLVAIKMAYGQGTAQSWLVAQLFDLSEFAGCRDKITEFQLRSLSELMLETYGYFKVSEFMLFFKRYKQGEFGKFYGVVDPMAILSNLKEFKRERLSEITKYEHEVEKERNAKNDQAWDDMRKDYVENVPYAYTSEQWMDFLTYQRYFAKADEKTRREGIRMAGVARCLSVLADVVDCFGTLMDDLGWRMAVIKYSENEGYGRGD